MENFTVKDSGKREEFGSGVRDTEDGKIDFTLILDGPMFDRWAAHLTKGAIKYAARNWLNFAENEEVATRAFRRAGRSLLRHTRQYMRREVDEDHAAAIYFNVNAREYLLSVYPNLTDGAPVRPDEERSGIPVIGDYTGTYQRTFILTGVARAPKVGEYYVSISEDGVEGLVFHCDKEGEINQRVNNGVRKIAVLKE